MSSGLENMLTTRLKQYDYSFLILRELPKLAKRRVRVGVYNPL